MLNVAIGGVQLNGVSGAVQQLFANNEPGAWYDPSDLSTLFQDSAGTTPVTGVEQPVGLMLDKSRGLVLGPELVTNGTFDTDSGWTDGGVGAGVSTISGGVLSLNGTPSNQAYRFQTIATVVGATYKIVATCNAVTSGSIQVGWDTGSGAAIASGITFSSARTSYFNFVATTTVTYIKVLTTATTGGVGSIDNISVRELPGNHATQTTTTSRPILRQEPGGQYYLAFDGTDDWLRTGHINFTSTDKMTVVAGVRKLSDAAVGAVAELSSSWSANNGTFAVYAPGDAKAARYSAGVRGTARAFGSVESFAAPISNVVTSLMNITATGVTNELVMRVDGVQRSLVNTSTNDAGTGNFGTHQLYIGRRGGTTLPFNGNLYGLIVRGAASTDAQINSAERWMAGKTGVTW